MKDKLYTVADIARITGYNRSSITRWIKKQKIENASMQANAPLYDAQVLEKFKKAHSSKDTKTTTKDELVYEKDARIKDLQEQVELLKDQLNIKDTQIQTLTEVAKQAQALNLTDKDPEKVRMLQGKSDGDSDASTNAVHKPAQEAEDSKDEQLQKENEDLKQQLESLQHRGFWKRLFNKN